MIDGILSVGERLKAPMGKRQMVGAKLNDMDRRKKENP
jgi:hypothetical protein